MEIKRRTVPNHLKVCRVLRQRMKLADEALRQLQSDEKGFEGECYFDQLINRSPASTYLQLQDVLLKWYQSTFQIDSVLLGPHIIYLFDVKTFEGEFYIEGNRWFSITGKEINNPIHQLRRSEALFCSLIETLGIHLPVESKIVFVHPEFTLYQANRNLPIILPTKLSAYLKSIEPVTVDRSLIEKAQKLASLHIDRSPFEQLKIPSYTYESLKKGTTCGMCGERSVQIQGKNLICSWCEHQENLEAGIIRMVEEYRLLFPNRLITVSSISDWCRLNIDRNKLYRILRKHYEMVGSGKNTFYR